MSDTEQTAAPVEALETDDGPKSNAAKQFEKADPEAVAGNGPETDEQPEAETDEEAPSETEPLRKKRKGLQDRLDELTAEKYANKAKAEQAERERDDLRKQLEELRKQPAPKADTGNRKTLEDFDFDNDAFVRYLAREEAAEMLKETETKAKQATAEQERAAKVSKFQAGVEAAKAANPEAEKLIFNDLAKFYTDDVVEFLHDSDDGVSIATYLGQNPAETDALLRMESPIQRLRALSRIEAKIGLPATAQPRTFTQAPAPVKSLSGSAPIKRDLGSMSMEEYAAERKRQIAGKRR